MRAAVKTDKRRIFDNLFAKLTAVKSFTGDETVLEFGIGRRGFGEYYLDKFKTVIGADVVDYSGEYNGVDFVLCGDGKIPVPDGSVDLLASHSVLEHVLDLDSAFSEFNRIVRVGGTLFLTVDPLYYSSFGSHRYVNGKRLQDWQHLDRRSRHYLRTDPVPSEPGRGHDLNKLTSSMFLSRVGKMPWVIDSYRVSYETKPVPAYVDAGECSEFDLRAKAFVFVGTKQEL